MPIDSTNTAPSKGKLSPIVKALMIGGQGFDGATTLSGLKSGNFKESNPILPNDIASILGIKAGTTAGSMYGLDKLAKNHPKIANTLGIGVGTAGIIPTLINLYRMNHK
jgi:hypothetical protein